MELSPRATSHFKKHLETSETLLWTGIPKNTPYTIPIFVPLMCGIGWLLYIIFLMGDAKPSWEHFFRALYLLTPVYLCLGVAMIFIRLEDQAYAFSQERLFIKKGNHQLIIINLKDIKKVDIGRFFFIRTLKITTSIRAKNLTLYDVKNTSKVYQQLNSFIQ